MLLFLLPTLEIIIKIKLEMLKVKDLVPRHLRWVILYLKLFEICRATHVAPDTLSAAGFWVTFNPPLNSRVDSLLLFSHI